MKQKFFFLLALTFFIGFSSCNDDDDDNSSEKIAGTWALSKVEIAFEPTNEILNGLINAYLSTAKMTLVMGEDNSYNVKVLIPELSEEETEQKGTYEYIAPNKLKLDGEYELTCSLTEKRLVVNEFGDQEMLLSLLNGLLEKYGQTIKLTKISAKITFDRV